jgi:predicted tellurium resistance membrane protein TerC
VLKLLFNIFLVYLVWQGIKLFISMSKVQRNMRKEMDDLNQKSASKSSFKTKQSKPLDGEYVDFEEID